MNGNVSIVLTDSTWPPEFWKQIAALHQREIPGGFLSTMSQEFLARLYSAIVRSEKAFLLAATNPQSGIVAGFICGSADSRDLMRQCIVGSGLKLITPLLPRLFSWRVLVRIFETLRYARQDDGPALPKAEILNFCVNSRLQGHGIGRQLFAALTSEFRRRGVERIKIVTGESQASAQRFYDAARARRAGGISIHGSANSVVFVYEIG